MIAAPRSPGGRREIRELLNANVCQPRQNRREILADWNVEATAAFGDRQDGGDPCPAIGLPMWIQFFLPIATPRIEFSARLLLSSTSGYWRKISSLGHRPSA